MPTTHDPASADSILLAAGEYLGRRGVELDFPGGRLVITHHEGGRALPAHAHELANLCVIASGSCEERSGRKTARRDEGEILWYPPESEHAVSFSSRRTSCVNVELDLRDVHCHELPMQADRRWPDRASRVLAGLRFELSELDPLTPTAVEALVWELLGLFRGAAPQRRRAMPAGVREARDVLEERFRDPPGLMQIAAEVGLHPSNLARSFRRWMGCSTGEYIRERRMREARRLLRWEPQRTLAEIAALCGYADQPHMTRAFRKRFGTTPLAVRGSNARSMQIAGMRKSGSRR